MKILFPLLFCLILTLSVKAQFSYDDKGQIIPFAMSKKYKNQIDTSKIPTCHLKSYNNDSLYHAKNKNIEGQGEFVGFSIDTLIDLKARGKKYKINEGTVWLYKIESKTAERLDIKIDQLIMPEEAYICLFPKKAELNINGPRVFMKNDYNYPVFRNGIYGNQLFIEYFEPNKVIKSANIIISNIIYTYAPLFYKKNKH